MQFGRRHAAAVLGVLALTAAACSGLTDATVSGSSSASSGSSSSSASSPDYPVGTIVNGIEAYLTAPTSDAPGVNIWSCKPSAAHPYPVVLVHGTMANAAFTWQALGPMLADAGYCVYELNYGALAPFSPPAYGLADLAQSASQLATFVDKVLASTGASKVDIVGHSQGGMMPRYYIQFLGGASKVEDMVGLAPANQGSSFHGLVELADDFDTLTGIDFVGDIGSELPASFPEMEQGSAFLQNLNAGGGTSPGVQYFNFESKYDEIVTPYTDAFLAAAPNVHNVLVQNYCATDYTEHIGIIYDPVTLALVMNALGADDPNYKPPCSVVLPVIGTLGNV